MTWTNVSKPTSSTYTTIRPEGKGIYDDPDFTYDDSTQFYDGRDPNLYTDIAKPTSSVYTKINKPS